MKSMRSLYKKLFHYVPDKRIWAYFSMALSAAAVCSYMGAYWFLWQSIVSILVIPVYEKAMYDAIIVVILMILRGILNIASPILTGVGMPVWKVAKMRAFSKHKSASGFV